MCKIVGLKSLLAQYYEVYQKLNVVSVFDNSIVITGEREFELWISWKHKTMPTNWVERHLAEIIDYKFRKWIK